MQALRAIITTAARSNAIKGLKIVQKTAFSYKYLFLTNVTISFTLSAVGDILEQKYEIYCDELNKWDPVRTRNMGISGISVGIVCHYWYAILDQRMPGRGIRTVVKKIILDQVLCSPVYISALFLTLGILEQKPQKEIWREIKEKAWRLYVAEWAVWPVAQFVNFYWLPTKYRVLYDNILSLGFDVYTSQVKHSD